MELTKEEVLKVAKNCAMGEEHCDELCPNCPWGNEKTSCVAAFAKYIIKNEPAPAGTGTSSEVSTNDTHNNLTHVDDSTKSIICQAYETADEACTNMLTIYAGMSPEEQRVFDIGEVFGEMCIAKDKLGKLKAGEGDES